MEMVKPFPIDGGVIMARTRLKAVVLEEEQRGKAGRISRSGTEEARRVRWAKTLLMARDGESDARIAAALGLNRNSVRNTISKFLALGLDAALEDLARPGRPTVIGDEAKVWVKSQACIKPKEQGYAQEMWTNRSLAAHIRAHCVEAGHPILSRVSVSKIRSILDEDDLKPWRMSD
jgi:transposase